MSVYAFLIGDNVDALAFELLFLLSFVNHHKSFSNLTIQRTIHELDCIYAHFIAMYYISTSLYWLVLSRSLWFLSSFINAGIISIFIYKTSIFPKLFVHVFVFLGCMSYIHGKFYHRVLHI